MKKNSYGIVVLLALFLFGCTADELPEPDVSADAEVGMESNQSVEGEQKEDGFDSDEERLAYSIGYLFGEQVRIFEDLNQEVLGEAFIEGYAQKEAKLATNVMQLLISEAHKKISDRNGEMAELALAEAKKWLEENKEQKGVVVTESGLQYEIIREGDDKKPKANTVVEVNYEGRLIDGTVFDSSYQRGQSIKFPLSGVIAGWTEGLQLIGVGGKIKLYIPPELGYGARGAGAIGPNEVLIFDVELLSVGKE